MMKSHKINAMRRHLVCSAAATCLAITFSAPGFAQDSNGEGADTGASSNTIIVTARKREESLQSVPLSISAFSTEALEDAGVSELRDLTYLVPGLSLTDFGAQTFSAPNIRGLTQANTSGGENNVSIFLDGVYVFNFNAIDLNLLDVERVEVIKGPVSALYGRNAFAGVINYVTKKPTDDLSVKLRGTAGSHGRLAASGAISGPIVEGLVSARAAVGVDNFDGTWSDPVNGVELGGYEKMSAQGALTFTPSPAIELNLSAFYSDDSFDPTPRSVLPFNCAVAGTTARDFCGPLPDGDLLAPQQPANPIAGTTANDREFLALIADFSADLGFATLDVLGGLTDVKHTRFVGFDGERNGLTFALVPGPGTANVSSYFGQDQADDDKSLEIRLSSPQSQSFRWTVGGYYYKLDRDVSTFIALDGRGLPANQAIAISPAFGWAVSRDGTVPRKAQFLASTEQISGFAGVDFDLTDRLTISGEARYTQEDKTQNTIRDLISNGDTDGPAGVAARFTFWDTRWTIDYQATDDVLLYASAASGTKSGGFNAGASGADANYRPEKNWTYEVGLKSILADGMVRANLAAFYIDWTDLQIVGISADPNSPGTVLRNAGAATSKGFELDISASVNEFLNVGGGLAYADPRFGEGSFDSTSRFNCSLVPTCAPDIVTRPTASGGTVQLVNLDGRSLHRQSDWQYNIFVELNKPIAPDWDLFARADYSYQSEQFAKVDNFATVSSVDNVNFRAGLRHDGFEITGWVRNLTDNTEVYNIGTSTRLNDFRTQNLGLLPERRTWGVTIGYSY